MNKRIPPAIAHLQANPKASVYRVAIDFSVSYSTLRRAWRKIQPGIPKVGRPENPNTPAALAYMANNPRESQKAIAQKFEIPKSTFAHAVARYAKRCEHCGGKIHAKA